MIIDSANLGRSRSVSVGLVNIQASLGLTKTSTETNPETETSKIGPETSLAETRGLVSVSLLVSDRLGSARVVSV